ncbi:unnamed protein product [Arctia plantaginis]|uniref:Uncharacterized protein n=1 Tax=Arctia plantaginis TaxID=874455 RepID=A0A8S1AP62_ARCPL|nr:unnamed protein product [Arctia plantaginis]
MFRIFTILWLTATPALGLWEKGLKVRFGIDPNDVESFLPLPETAVEAEGAGWKNVTGLAPPEGYEKLFLMCPENDYTLCMFYDDTGYVAGYQISFDPARFTNANYNWTVSGYKTWTAIENGVSIDFHTVTQYFMSPAFLNTPAETRIAKRNRNTILQDNTLYVTGFNGKLYPVPTSIDKIKSDGIYTPQGCMAGMGNHYYYNMTTSLPCGEDSIFTWFVLEYDDSLTAMGFLIPGKYSITEGHTDYFELPTRPFIEMNAPRAPECIYRYPEEYGMLTMHLYFIKEPYDMTCVD